MRLLVPEFKRIEFECMQLAPLRGKFMGDMVQSDLLILSRALDDSLYELHVGLLLPIYRRSDFQFQE